jgi:hypothetical protein
MTVQAGSNKWSTTKDGHNMETFKNHIESMRGVFRWSHTNVQNVAVVARDSFEEHDGQIKVFRCVLPILRCFTSEPCHDKLVTPELQSFT